jgi:hypothetical protein
MAGSVHSRGYKIRSAAMGNPLPCRRSEVRSNSRLAREESLLKKPVSIDLPKITNEHKNLVSSMAIELEGRGMGKATSKRP